MQFRCLLLLLSVAASLAAASVPDSHNKNNKTMHQEKLGEVTVTIVKDKTKKHRHRNATSASSSRRRKSRMTSSRPITADMMMYIDAAVRSQVLKRFDHHNNLHKTLKEHELQCGRSGNMRQQYYDYYSKKCESCDRCWYTDCKFYCRTYELEEQVKALQQDLTTLICILTVAACTSFLLLLVYFLCYKHSTARITTNHRSASSTLVYRKPGKPHSFV